MKYVFLNNNFFAKYKKSKYPQIEQKVDRPYIHVIINRGNRYFAIPLRSNIKHPYVFFTDKKNHCGVDYSKAIPVTINDIDNNRIPHLRQQEFNRLKGKDFKIKNGLQKYINTYQNALIDETFEHRKQILSNSTIQYFHKEFGIKEDHNPNKI